MMCVMKIWKRTRFLMSTESIAAIIMFTSIGEITARIFEFLRERYHIIYTREECVYFG